MLAEALWPTQGNMTMQRTGTGVASPAYLQDGVEVRIGHVSWPRAAFKPHFANQMPGIKTLPATNLMTTVGG